MNEQLPTTELPIPEHYPAVEMYVSEGLAYEPLTWQRPELVRAGDVVKITDINNKLLIFACHNPRASAAEVEGALAEFADDLALQAMHDTARLTLAHPASALQAAGVPFVELELLTPDKKTRFQPLVAKIEKTFVPQLEDAVRYDLWKREATAVLTEPTARAVLDRAAQHLEEKARVEQDATRYLMASKVLRELQE